MADEANDTISRQAFERVKADLEAAKQQLAEREQTLTQATQALSDVALIDKAYQSFKEQPGVADPYALARRAARDVTLKGVPDEEFGPKLQSWFEEEKSLWASPASTDAPAPPAETGPVPGFARPSPASTGTAPPAQEKLSANSPEFQRLLRDNNRAEIERLDKEGLIAWSPLVQDNFGRG